MSEIKVNKISPRTACGTTTLGDSGDTFTIPSGVTITNNGTQTGFGRTGTVDWITTPKTTGFTAVSGNGYFCDTSGGEFTATLPASPTAGDIVAFSDYTRTFASKKLTIGRNSKPIGGVAQDGYLIVNGQSATFVFVDDTEGWININETQTSQTGILAAYVTATGGTPCSGAIVCTNYKVHTFTGPGTFTVSCAGNAGGSNTVDYMVIAGGGGAGGGEGTGAGGAGGYRESPGTASGCYTASPLGVAPAVALPVSVTGYPITVGGGGSGGTPAIKGTDGNPSSFSTITSTAGGGGGAGGGAGGGTEGQGIPYCANSNYELSGNADGLFCIKKNPNLEGPDRMDPAFRPATGGPGGSMAHGGPVNAGIGNLMSRERAYTYPDGTRMVEKVSQGRMPLGKS